MTTIVYNAGVLVADSLLTDDDTKHLITKIQYSRSRKAYIATAGDFFAGLQFCEWFNDRRRKAPHPDSDFEALVVYENGTIELWSAMLVPAKLSPDEPFAIGSGAQAALGALKAGADAVTACQIACEIDPGSSLPVRPHRVFPYAAPQ